MKSAKRFVLLDRDGTIIEDRHYLADPDKVKIIPGVIEGMHALRDMGLGLVVVTNQSGLGRKLFRLEQLEQVNQRLRDLLAAEGVVLDGIYYCPHHPEEKCACRKPRPGMVNQAARELGFVPKGSFVIGDRESDIALGKNVGAVTFLVRTGYGLQVEADGKVSPDFVIDSLEESVPIIARAIQVEAD